MVGQDGTDGERRRGRLSVAGQLRLALGASIVVLAAILGVAFYVPYELNRSSDERYVEDVIPLRSDVRELVVHVATGEAAASEYIATGAPPALNRYYRAFTDASADLTALEVHAERHPSLTPLLRRAAEQIADLQGVFERRILLAELERVRTESDVREVQRLFDRVRETADRMQTETDAFVQEAQDEQQSTYRRLLVTLGWLGAIGLAIGAALFVVTPRRVVELYRAEQRARREAEDRADAARALAHVSDGVVLTGTDGDLRFWNPAAAALLDLDEGEPSTRALPELLPRRPGPGGPSGAANGPVVVPVGTRSGERWLSITSVDFGEGVVYAIRDVTEERTLETMRSDFLATASHELRTPMTSIYGAARTLLARDGELTRERREAFLEMIANESERLARIVDGILLASRLDAGELDLTTEQCDADTLARSVLDAAELHAPENVSLRMETASALPKIACDPNRLRQVLLNLVDNAIKYSPDGGEVVLSIARSGDEAVRFRVTDKGLGFPSEERQRIFERFYRIDPGLRRGIGGTGLGLYISRELVERMGGRIWADSEPGQGSAFSLELPIGGPQPHLPTRE